MLTDLSVPAADAVTLADTVDGQNVQDVALSAAENLLTANPDMTAIYATGEPALSPAEEEEQLVDGVGDRVAEARRVVGDEFWCVPRRCCSLGKPAAANACQGASFTVYLTAAP